MLLKRCDRCGRIRAPKKMMGITLKTYKENSSAFLDSFYYDLCEDCYTAFLQGFKKFMK